MGCGSSRSSQLKVGGRPPLDREDRAPGKGSHSFFLPQVEAFKESKDGPEPDAEDEPVTAIKAPRDIIPRGAHAKHMLLESNWAQPTDHAGHAAVSSLVQRQTLKRREDKRQASISPVPHKTHMGRTVSATSVHSDGIESISLETPSKEEDILLLEAREALEVEKSLETGKPARKSKLEMFL